MSKRGGAASGAQPGHTGAVAGIDPGRVGAMVIVDERHVREIVTWDTTKDVAPLVMRVCQAHGVELAVVEWASSSRGRGERMSPAARITLSMRVQMAMSGAACAGAEVVHVVPDRWRADVLRLSAQTPGEAAKRAAMGACWGGVVRRLDVSLGLVWPDEVERSSHVAEAACLAVWGRDGYAGRVKRGSR